MMIETTVMGIPDLWSLVPVEQIKKSEGRSSLLLKVPLAKATLQLSW